MTRLSFISDTHTKHPQLTQHIIAAKPEVLVHCGDWSDTGTVGQVGDFAGWCAMLLRKEYVKHVVAISGNHELGMQSPDAEHCRHVLKHAGVVYLEDELEVVAGLSFYGSPWTPRFYDWAFQLDGLEQADSCFGNIPEGTDVVVTHGPPYGILDKNLGDERTGSRMLLKHIERVKPKIHAFGHIHYSYGLALHGGTLFINAATCGEDYKPTHPIITVNV